MGMGELTSYCSIFMDGGGVVGPAMLRVSMILRQWECSRVLFIFFFFFFSFAHLGVMGESGVPDRNL